MFSGDAAVLGTMDQVFGNPLIVANILSFLDQESDLRLRVLNKVWNAEVLIAYPRWEEGPCPYLQLGPYLDQKDSPQGCLIPSGSTLLTRVFAAGRVDKENDAEDFLTFFESGDGRSVQDLSLCLGVNYKGRDVISWGDALYRILQNNGIPLLTKLVIDFDFEGECDAFQKGDKDFSRCTNDSLRSVYGSSSVSRSQRPAFSLVAENIGLSNLTVLDIRCGYNTESVREGCFTPFIKAILRGAINLEELFIKGTFFPEESVTEGLKKLKFFKLEIPEYVHFMTDDIEIFLEGISNNLEELHLKFLSMDFPIDFPKLPKLKKLYSLSARNLPLKRFIRFLGKKMPLLQSLIIPDQGQYTERYEAFAKALHSSKGVHTGLQFLAIPAPEKARLLKGLSAKFPSLKDLYVNLQYKNWTADREADMIAEVAAVLAKDGFLCPVNISHDRWYRGTNGGHVKEKILEILRSENYVYKGTIEVDEDSDGSLNGIRLVPEENQSN